MARRVGASTVPVALAVVACMACGACATGDFFPDDAASDVVRDSLDRVEPPDMPVVDVPATDEGGDIDDHGFLVRVPRQHTVPTEVSGGQTGWSQAWDLDWMCTFRHAGVDATFYLQDRPLKDGGWILGGIIWQTAGAWMAIDGRVVAVDAQYDSGGNHRNDWTRVDFRGAVYRYYHSSMGISWRKCQAMDCLQVLDPADDLTVLEDGCTSSRTLPVWCVQVGQDGSVPPPDDAFHKCPGDNS